MTDQTQATGPAHTGFRKAVLIVLAFYIVVALLLLVMAPAGPDGGIGWSEPWGTGWMAWTLASAAFFYTIAALLSVFTLLAIRFPETPRRGILGIETTRGDRLFITLLGSAFINLAWLGIVATMQPLALLVCLVYAAAVFRWV